MLSEILEKYKGKQPFTLGDTKIERSYPISAVIDMMQEYAEYKRIKWQPIETAPKDGTIVLVCRDDHYFIQTAAFRTFHPNMKGEADWRSTTTGAKLEPTHWMLLPEKPESLTTKTN